MVLSPLLSLMGKAARQAGESLLSDFANRGKLRIDFKNPGDFVSQADRHSEEIIVGILRNAYPDWGILGEEGTNHAVGGGHRWITDPLDGTTNFLHGYLPWCVTIALEKEKEIIAGLIFDPVRNELFTAEKGKGAFMNGNPIRVSTCKEMNKALCCIDTGLNDPAEWSKYHSVFSKIENGNGSTTRILGSAALDLAYLAAGRSDCCYLQGKVKPWDIAAGILIIKEAGGKLTDFNLQPANHEIGEIIAANPVLHEKLVSFLEIAQ